MRSDNISHSFMRSNPACVVGLFLLLGSGCVFDSDRRVAVDLGARTASAFVFRGQTMTERAVAQTDTVLQLPTRDGGTGSVGMFGNLDLDDGVGDAWMDPDHAGEFTQIDLWAGWARDFGGVDVALGLRHYAWPNGESFRFAPFPSTSEVFASVGVDVLGLHPRLTMHRDIDEVDSAYVQGEVSHTVALATSAHLEMRTWLGWSDADHSRWLYRSAESAFADLGASLGVRVDLDPVTSLRVAVLGSTIVDSTLRDWFATRVDADVLWFTVGIAWAF